MKIKYILLSLLSICAYAQNSIIDPLAEKQGSFMPSAGKYIVSGWVKEFQSIQPISYTSTIAVTLTNGSSIVTSPFVPSGLIIDGWQRILGIIEIPGSLDPTATIKIDLNCTNNNGDCYFDDIRFFPYDGNLKSFVYDEDTQRLMAELDENNYATFYEYDIEGGLVRVKKETEKGVYTIQETRSNTVKKTN
jgi:hypothetical protein